MTDLDPLAEDLSAYILGGRSSDAGLGIAQAEDAERLGFRRVFLSERYNLKEAGVLFGGIAARTTRLEVGTGAMTLGARLPIVTAAMGATLHSAFGPRCVLGLGLGAAEFNQPHGLGIASYAAAIDYADILKRLWRGERVDYDGPAGSYTGLIFSDVYDGPAPQVWLVHLGGPKACAASANPAFDGVMLGMCSTPDAIAASVRNIHAECERIGRDPATLRICVPVPTAPDADPRADDAGGSLANPSYGSGLVDFAALKVFLTVFVTQPTLARGIVHRNGWDENVIARILAHPLFSETADDATPDLKFRDRMSLMSAAELLPDSWISESCAVGSVEACARKLADFRAAGADEIATYVSAPAQNAGLIGAWRDRLVGSGAAPPG